MSTDFNVDTLLADLDSKKDAAGSLRLWRVDMAKVEANAPAIMQLPKQARICVKAAILLSRENESGNFSMTVPMIADKAVELGLETRQPAARIVRYYFAQLKDYVLDAVK